MKLYPNPTTGKMTLECNLQENQSGLLLIYNLTGNIIGSYQLTTGSKTVVINVETLQAGMYQYQVIVDGKRAQIDKLIIIK
jgi:hypothetical protein